MEMYSRKSFREISTELRVEALEAHRLAETFSQGQAALDLMRYAVALELQANLVLEIQ